jgi:DnaJ-class molecular chaperone
MAKSKQLKWETVICPTCQGSGRRGNRSCRLCKGTGKIKVPSLDDRAEK